MSSRCHFILQAAKKVEGQLVTKHDSACPWRRSVCDPSVAQFVPLATEVVLSGFQARCGALCELDRLPPLASLSEQHLSATHRHTPCSTSFAGRASYQPQRALSWLSPEQELSLAAPLLLREEHMLAQNLPIELSVSPFCAKLCITPVIFMQLTMLAFRQ